MGSSREDSLRRQDPQFASFSAWGITLTTCLPITLQQGSDPEPELASLHTPSHQICF